MWPILLHHMMCDSYMYVKPIKMSSGVVKVWKWPHCSVTLRHIITCGTVSSIPVCVWVHNYDAGVSITSWVSGWRWNWLKFNLTITSPVLVSVQPIRLSKICMTSGIEFDWWNLPWLLQCSRCLHRQHHNYCELASCVVVDTPTFGYRAIHIWKFTSERPLIE